MNAALVLSFSFEFEFYYGTNGTLQFHFDSRALFGARCFVLYSAFAEVFGEL